MYLHRTTDTGVTICRVVLGRYTIHLGDVRIGRVFGDAVIGFTAYDNDGELPGYYDTLDAAAAAVQFSAELTSLVTT
jgi:hypothetical protein